jgi:hypothetical protein
MAQLIVNPAIDSTMDYVSLDTNYGQSSTIGQGVLIAGGQKGALRRAIANFDVSAIPVAAVITQAKLQRTLTLADPSPHSVRIARCTRPTQWTENGVTWNKYDGVNAWTTGGGDYDDATPAAVSYVEAVAPGPHEITGLGGFVRDALDLRNGIVSLLLRNGNEAPAVSERSTWLAATFWHLVIDYNVTAEPGRRSALVAARSRRPSAPRAPPGGRRPSRPSIGREGRRS